jgi:hypothetical protein
MDYSNHKISDFDISLTLEIEGNIVDKRHDLTIGALTLIRGKKTFVLDFKQSTTTYNENQNLTEIKCTFPDEHFEVLEDGSRYNEEFPDCKFDLPIDSFFEGYKVLWLDGDLDAEIKRKTFHAIYRDEEGVVRSSLSARVLEWSEYEKHLTDKEGTDSTDYIEYQGEKYKTRTLTMIEEGVGEITRTIADESLYNAITEDGTDYDAMEDDTTEEGQIDCQIYHYVEVGQLELSGEEICKNCLDLEFEFIEE